jgi:malate synthase
MNSEPHILGETNNRRASILSREALIFLSELHARFEPRRKELLERRERIAGELRRGSNPSPPAETEWVRLSDWQVAPPPFDLLDRRVEITGPTDAKMMINAMNSGAKVFMADLEDSLSPTWSNVIDGQVNLRDAVERRLEYRSPEGKVYKLKADTATLMVRPRGWHLSEVHFAVAGRPISASLFDFGLFFFHNAHPLHARGSGPLFYLPKLENRFEARLWNDVFNFSQNYMGLSVGTIRATVLIETCLAAFEMEEILFELREHICALNAGRWDYLFSMIKKFAHRDDLSFPDRAQLTMTVPFMRAYTKMLVEVCHKRGAHAIGGMAAFIPSRRDSQINERALVRVVEDKTREAEDGFDGTWVAHPDLVPVAMSVFDRVLGPLPHQKSKRFAVIPSIHDLLPSQVPGGKVTTVGVVNNISVSLQYLNSWLQGTGAVTIFNLMEDAATAEIARAELWQWVRQKVTTEEGLRIDQESFARLSQDVVRDLGGLEPGRMKDAYNLLSRLVLSAEFIEFLTLPAYEILETN